MIKCCQMESGSIYLVGGIWESPGIPPVWLIERECVEGKVRVCSHGWCDLGPAPGDQRCER